MNKLTTLILLYLLFTGGMFVVGGNHTTDEPDPLVKGDKLPERP